MVSFQCVIPFPLRIDIQYIMCSAVGVIVRPDFSQYYLSGSISENQIVAMLWKNRSLISIGSDAMVDLIA